MKLMNESGRSSEQLLNNIVTSATGDTKLAEGLELSRTLLEGKGAWRVHGGGFAGCVQALMPTDYFPTYKEIICRHQCLQIISPPIRKKWKKYSEKAPAQKLNLPDERDHYGKRQREIPALRCG